MRHFPGWEEAVLHQAAAFLSRGWQQGPLDLRHRLLIVPTQHAGRRLREHLATVAAQRGTAVLAGPVETPSRLFAPVEQAGAPIASEIAAELFWRRTLRACPTEKRAALSALHLADQPRALASTAEHLALLRTQLCEEGHTLTSFAARTTFEKERWDSLAQLEQLYLAMLQQAGWRDDTTEKLAAAQHPALPPGISQVVVLFVPDPPPLAVRALAALAEIMPVDICIHAAKAEAGLFDEWGRPIPERWKSRALPLDARRIEICDDPLAMNELLRRRIAGVAREGRANITVGIGERATAVRLAQTLAQAGIPAFDPSGRSAQSLPLFQLISRLFEFNRARTFAAFLALARHPDALCCLEGTAGMPQELLAALDQFQNRHMPVTFEDALHLAEMHRQEDAYGAGVVAALREAAGWLETLEGRAPPAPLSESLPALLTHIFQERMADPLLQKSAALFHALLERLRPLELLQPARTETPDLFLRLLPGKTLPEERPPDAIELLGWLELAWEDAPILLLADLNDGVIPEAATADPFLPDSVRRVTGLRDNRFRMARDAHTLESIIRSRRVENIQGFMPRRSPAGDPLKPSRLLLQCPPQELAARAVHFFSDAPSPFPSVTRGPGWPLQPPLPAPDLLPTTVSATAFKNYLACPFTFYLERVLRLRDPFVEKNELDPAEFGTVCHAVFEAFAASDLRGSANAKEITRFLQGQTRACFRQRFGDDLPLPLVIQRELLLQRMAYAGPVQARARREGWLILKCEWAFDIELAGLRFKGRIDRIDQHEADGRLRIIDYKTTAQATPPEKAHRTALKSNSTCPAYARSPDGNWGWRDLQLPLYIHAWQTLNGKGQSAIEAAYFALPNAVAETGLLPWEQMNEALVAEAVACAQRIIHRIRAGVFWPPLIRVRQPEEPLYRLFFADVERFLDPAFTAAMKALARRHEDAGGGGP